MLKTIKLDEELNNAKTIEKTKNYHVDLFSKPAKTNLIKFEESQTPIKQINTRPPKVKTEKKPAEIKPVPVYSGTLPPFYKPGVHEFRDDDKN